METPQSRMQRFARFISDIDRDNLAGYKTQFFNQIDEFAESIKDAPDRKELEDRFYEICGQLKTSVMHERCRAKPLGYAGDYLVIDWIYNHKTARSGKGKVFDEMFQNYEAARAVRNRKQYFIDKCATMVNGQPRFDLLDVGCGPCRDVIEALEATGKRNLFVKCVDIEPKAIAYAKRLLAKSPMKEQVRLECANIFRYKTEDRFDLIWSAGLFDYLNDKTAAFLIKRLWGLLKEGGRIIFGNFGLDNPTRNGMELVTRWNLIHRSANDLVSICKQSSIDFSEIEIQSEELGINLFCVIRK
jgi:extracellular factor (EF) 3-hydroxypalmitic acid methyl ester biosynthesis protein